MDASWGYYKVRRSTMYTQGISAESTFRLQYGTYSQPRTESYQILILAIGSRNFPRSAFTIVDTGPEGRCRLPNIQTPPLTW